MGATPPIPELALALDVVAPDVDVDADWTSMSTRSSSWFPLRPIPMLRCRTPTRTPSPLRRHRTPTVSLSEPPRPDPPGRRAVCVAFGAEEPDARPADPTDRPSRRSRATIPTGTATPTAPTSHPRARRLPRAIASSGKIPTYVESWSSRPRARPAVATHRGAS